MILAPWRVASHEFRMMCRRGPHSWSPERAVWNPRTSDVGECEEEGAARSKVSGLRALMAVPLEEQNVAPAFLGEAATAVVLLRADALPPRRLQEAPPGPFASKPAPA